MAPYNIFRQHLAIKFATYGYALWEPDPGSLYPAVEVGDVGYICEGKFHRLFNVLLPAIHPSHRNFGVPEYHEQLTLNMENHINTGTLSPNNFCSAKVTSIPVLSERSAEGPDEITKVSFSCPMKEGAVLSLPIQAKRENTVANADFGKWIIRHIDCWFAWARQLGLGIDRMEDIILVTGTHRTRSCTNVAFPGGRGDAQASFGAKVDHRGDTVAVHWQFSPERNRGAVLNWGPDGEDLPEDQCIFIRGFRVTRRLKILPPKLKGAAGPNPDPEGDDEEPDVELLPIPSLPEYRDPLHILLEFIAEGAPPSCDMLIVHDDDLARLNAISDGTQLDALQPDVLLSRIRSLRPMLHFTRIDLLPSAHNSASAETESAGVATLSNIFEKQSLIAPSSKSSESATQSFRVETTSKRHVLPSMGPISGSDPITDLMNYLQGHPSGNLTSQFSWMEKHDRSLSYQAIYHVTAMFRGTEIGHGSNPRMSLAKRQAAIQALKYFQSKLDGNDIASITSSTRDN